MATKRGKRGPDFSRFPPSGDFVFKWRRLDDTQSTMTGWDGGWIEWWEGVANIRDAMIPEESESQVTTLLHICRS